MRRKPEFPTKEAWLARRGLGHSSASPDASPGSDEQASPGSEPEAKPVITLRPKRPYWR